jgi:flagellar motor switch protein FliN/FliY
MGEGSLSQDEIDALLAGADDSSFDLGGGMATASGGGESGLSPIDRDIISDILNTPFTSAGSTLSTLTGKGIRFTNPSTESRTANELTSELGNNTVCFNTNITGPVNGRIAFVFAQENAVKLAGLMMGGAEPSSNAVDSATLQTLKDMLSPVLGMLTVQLGMKLNVSLVGSPPEASIATNARDIKLPEGVTMVKTQFTLNIDGGVSFKVNFIQSLDMANQVLDVSKNGAKAAQQGGGAGINMNMGGGGMGMQNPQAVGIRGVSFPSLATAGAPMGNPNLNILMDVQMALTVELGRTKMYIKDILGLGEGSIIELDKLAGEPVDLLVNGKLIAKGEVVVIDENFGVRVTDIVSPADRIKNAKG